ncbi:MAG: class II aldolase/adducin family protein [Chloroflexi bacterium]|nr:class II aldolase/adducin family protein [Chloroflexota bacterium]MCC6895332.1 class II aldolase/adducin family protein [Anaerolineae bacterium]
MTLAPLLDMTRTIGQPHMDYVIIGEGNTSARIDADTFWIKASGQQMVNITETGFVAVRFAPILAMLDQSAGDLAAQKAVMQAAKVDAAAAGIPSVEVTFHAMLLHECGVNYIGHTHATAVNRIMCSPRAFDFATHRMFPDEAVLCGPESVYVAYEDPGLPLALAIRDGVRKYMAEWGEAPKVILLGNHGVIALGNTPQEILNITAMTVKAARIFEGASGMGGPVFLSREDVLHIVRRPDEIYRRNLFVEKTSH